MENPKLAEAITDRYLIEFIDYILNEFIGVKDITEAVEKFNQIFSDKVGSQFIHRRYMLDVLDRLDWEKIILKKYISCSGAAILLWIVSTLILKIPQERLRIVISKNQDNNYHSYFFILAKDLTEEELLMAIANLCINPENRNSGIASVYELVTRGGMIITSKKDLPKPNIPNFENFKYNISSVPFQDLIAFTDLNSLITFFKNYYPILSRYLEAYKF